MKTQTKKVEPQPRQKLIEGEDFYFENGLMVLTAHFLRERGYCCKNNCRNCPYSPESDSASKQKNG